MENRQAPSFTLQDQQEQPHSLEDYRGKWVLLYFYPKDMTPGCTLEAQSFKEYMDAYREEGVHIIGVSADSCESHRRFAQKFQLNFTLLADEEAVVSQLYGVWKEKSLFGKKFWGIERESFLINPEGIIVKHYTKVKPNAHAAEALADVKAFKKPIE